jgi:NAD+ diphosphatase
MAPDRSSGGDFVPPRAFRLCPSCGAPDPAFLDGKRWLCRECGFEYYHNVATAVGAILDRAGEIVFLERALDPGKGKLGLPGGFVDPGERAEEALRRECLEEIGWAPPSLSFLASFPNRYPYKGIEYRTCDFYFYHRLPAREPMPRIAPRDGESVSIRVVPLGEIRIEDLAFESLARAIKAYGSLPAGGR